MCQINQCVYIYVFSVAISAQPVIKHRQKERQSASKSMGDPVQAFHGMPSAPEAEMPVALMNKVFKDQQTGLLIPTAVIMKNLQILDKYRNLLAESSKVYHEVMRDYPGTYEEKKAVAKARSDKVAGGSRTAIWNKMAREKVIQSMVVKAPPANDHAEATANEDKLRMMIYRVDQWLNEEIVDVWTSVKELGGLQQTFIYVRFPYHLAYAIKNLALCINAFDVDTHKFFARVIFEGRAKLSHPARRNLQEWELSINGNKLAPMTAAEMAEATTEPTGTAYDRFVTAMSVECNKFLRIHNGQEVDMNKYLVHYDVNHLQQFNAFKYDQVLRQKNDLEIAKTYFTICGLIINAVDRGNTLPSPTLTIYTAKIAMEYPGNIGFLSFQKGDMFLALDAPFVCHMSASDDIQQDGAIAVEWGRGMPGVRIAYVLKFTIEEQIGMNIIDGGIVFQQHMDVGAHPTKVQILSKIMSPHIARLGGVIAASGASGPSPAPSSASSAPVLGLAMHDGP